MGKHTSLLLMTYLCGLIPAFMTVLALSPDGATLLTQGECMPAFCQPFANSPQSLNFFLITGAVLGYGTILLSRGLYRLFFIETK